MIDIDELTEIYLSDLDGFENKGWIAINDSKSGEITTNIRDGSGGDFGNGWRMYISIAPCRIGGAAVLIANILNEEDSPRVSIQFASRSLALSGQPSKQIALCFYGENLTDSLRINVLFNKIEAALIAKDIKVDLRPMCSDARGADFKRGKYIKLSSGQPSRFGYCNEDCSVIDDPFASIIVSPQFEARAFRYARGSAGYHLSFNTRGLQSRGKLLEQGRRNLSQLLGCKLEPNEETTSQTERDKILEEYESLLASGPEQKLNDFIELHKEKLIRLQYLDDKYGKMYDEHDELQRKWASEYASRTVKSQSINSRKHSFFSNIKYHFNNNENQREFNNSMLIVPGIFLGSSLTIVGSIVLIPTINTFLLPMPITMICLGVSLIVAGLILVKMDCNNAFKEDKESQTRVDTLAKQYEGSGDELFKAYNEIRSITFSC